MSDAVNLQQAIQGVIRELVGIVEILLQGADVLVAGDLDDLVHRFAGSDQIGRASCRERVSSPV